MSKKPTYKDFMKAILVTKEGLLDNDVGGYNEKVKFVKSEKLYSPFLIMKDRRLRTKDKILELNKLNMAFGRKGLDKKIFDYLRFMEPTPVGTLEKFMKEDDEES